MVPLFLCSPELQIFKGWSRPGLMLGFVRWPYKGIGAEPVSLGQEPCARDVW
jgi:hypothetical protein